jgi:hypothetical protein
MIDDHPDPVNPQCPVIGIVSGLEGVQDRDYTFEGRQFIEGNRHVSVVVESCKNRISVGTLRRARWPWTERSHASTGLVVISPRDNDWPILPWTVSRNGSDQIPDARIE